MDKMQYDILLNNYISLFDKCNNEELQTVISYADPKSRIYNVVSGRQSDIKAQPNQICDSQAWTAYQIGRSLGLQWLAPVLLT